MRIISRILAISLLASQLAGCFAAVVGGAAAGGVMAADRRTSGIYIEDQSIELKAVSQINQELGENIHVNVTSFNRNVLITGEAFNEETKKRTGEIVKGIENVRNVTNELTIGPRSSLSSRSNDTFITSKVKGRFTTENRFPANYVKVVTERSVVYLMGLVTRQEAADAVEIASSTSDVEKVVKVFEYID